MTDYILDQLPASSIYHIILQSTDMHSGQSPINLSLN